MPKIAEMEAQSNPSQEPLIPPKGAPPRRDRRKVHITSAVRHQRSHTPPSLLQLSQPILRRQTETPPPKNHSPMAQSRRAGTPPPAEPALLRRPRPSYTPDLRDLVRGFAPEMGFISAPPTPALRDLYSGGLPLTPGLCSAGPHAHGAETPFSGGSAIVGASHGTGAPIVGCYDDAVGVAGGGGDVGAVKESEKGKESEKEGETAKGKGKEEGKETVDEKCKGKENIKVENEKDGGSASGRASANDGSGASANATDESATRAGPPGDIELGDASEVTPGVGARARVGADAGIAGSSGSSSGFSRAGHIAAMSALFFPVAPVDAALAATSSVSGPVPSLPFHPALQLQQQQVQQQMQQVQQQMQQQMQQQVQQQQQHMQHLHQLYQAQSMYFLNGAQWPMVPQGLGIPGIPQVPLFPPLGAEFGGTSLTSSPDLTKAGVVGANEQQRHIQLVNAATPATDPAPTKIEQLTPPPGDTTAVLLDRTQRSGSTEGESGLKGSNSKTAAGEESPSTVPPAPAPPSAPALASAPAPATAPPSAPAPATAPPPSCPPVSNPPAPAVIPSALVSPSAVPEPQPPPPPPRVPRSSKQRRQLAVERAGCSANQAKLNRAAAIERLRAKKQARTFQLKVRYACRKRIASSRPRINGRFATKEEVAEARRLGIELQ